MKRLLITSMAALTFAVAACSTAASPSPSPAPSQEAAMDDIVATADAAGTFKTLLTAATAAGLVETLQGPGPFTVFAPTDEAFAALPAGTLDSLLADPRRSRRSCSTTSSRAT